jgi:two-component sensor histidine kinase/uncharacterized protein with PQ loop repeat
LTFAPAAIYHPLAGPDAGGSATVTTKPKVRWRLMSVWIILACVAAAFLFSVFVFLPNFFHDFRSAINWEFGIQFLIQLAAWLSWAILAPLIIIVGRRLRRAGLKRRILVPAHLASALVFILAHSGLYVAVGSLIFSDNAPISLPRLVLVTFNINILVYGLIMSGSLGFDYYRESRDRESAAARLEAQLADARLQALKTQIHPHFLFNTLHGISALISVDPEAAEGMIGRLSELLRRTLDSAGRQEISLKEEAEALGLYLEIMALRHKDRLAFSIRLEPGTEAAIVPSFILQPLVENAVRHGIAPFIQGGAVEVRSRREGERLVLDVADSGPGFREDLEILRGRGLGLNNTVVRLELLYGESGRLKLGQGGGGGGLVSVEIPFRTAAEAG